MSITQALHGILDGEKDTHGVVEQAPIVLAQNVDSQSSSEFHFNDGKIFPPNKLGRVHDIMVMKSNSSGKCRMSYE